jgi:two-component system chemotaxis response regulator CheB
VQTQFVRGRQRLRAGVVFVAPPDRHLVVRERAQLDVEDSPKLNYVRPAADRLFETAAAQLGSRVLCVVLTGMGCDGARGAAAVKAAGGMVIVQDPDSAEADSMPRAALRATAADLVLPLEAIPSALTSLCNVIGTRELFCGRQDLIRAA